MKTSNYESKNGHHQIWVYDGRGLPVLPEIKEWLSEVVPGKCIGICNFVYHHRENEYREGTFYNFSCKDAAMLFKLTWG